MRRWLGAMQDPLEAFQLMRSGDSMSRRAGCPAGGAGGAGGELPGGDEEAEEEEFNEDDYGDAEL